MPAYVYCCDCGLITDENHPMGEAPRESVCTCGLTARLVIGAGVQIAPSALEAKGEAVRRIEATEDRWQQDMPAYQRMRNRGMQPNGIDGCAALENEVGDQLDISHRELFKTGVSRDRVIEGAEMAREIMEDGVTT